MSKTLQRYFCEVVHTDMDGDPYSYLFVVEAQNPNHAKNQALRCWTYMRFDPDTFDKNTEGNSRSFAADELKQFRSGVGTHPVYIQTVVDLLLFVQGPLSQSDKLPPKPRSVGGAP